MFSAVLSIFTTDERDSCWLQATTNLRSHLKEVDASKETPDKFVEL